MIGVFDSGSGGLSVWKELVKLMPSEDYYYISDAAYCPYGPKSKEMVVKRATAISEFLIERGAEIIVTLQLQQPFRILGNHLIFNLLEWNLP